jgi:DNA-binding MarR family transcriptional regulator
MPFNIEESVGFTTNRTAKLLKKEMAGRLKTLELTPEQWTLLNVIGEHGAISQADLVRKTFKDRSVISRVLGSLLNKGLARKYVNPADKRVYLVKISAKGKKKWEAAMPLAVQFNKDMKKCLTEHETEELIRLLNKITECIA